MEYDPDAEARSTPKLSFYSLPSKSSEPAGMLTPPLQSPASVPFVWEDAPGKPRTSNSKPSTIRSLELPPRLLTEMKTTNLPSPTTVLDGPNVGRSISFSYFRDIGQRSFRVTLISENSSNTPEKERLLGFWGRVGGGRGKGKGHRRAESAITSAGEGELDLGFSSSSSSSAAAAAPVDGERTAEEEEKKVKITRLRRKGSLLNIYNATSHFWASIYGSLKQVVPWKLRRLKKKDGLL